MGPAQCLDVESTKAKIFVISQIYMQSHFNHVTFMFDNFETNVLIQMNNSSHKSSSGGFHSFQVHFTAHHQLAIWTLIPDTVYTGCELLCV